MNGPVLSLRIARDCFEAESVSPTRCPCCGSIKLLLVDGQDRVRAIADLTPEQLRNVLALAEAGTLPSFDPRAPGARTH